MAADRPLSVVFCWAEVSGYMPACWRALGERPGVTCHVLHPQQLEGTPKNPFDLEPLLAGLSHDMFQRTRGDLEAWLAATVAKHHPDVVVMCGWMFWPYTSLMDAPALANVPFVIGMDTPWLGTLRQRMAWVRLNRLVARTSAFVTASERSAEYARRLGVPAARIHRGYYGFDETPLAPVAEQRRAGSGWPRQFLFVGRYIEEKGLSTLMVAYRRYRSRVDQPWSLTCCGSGPAESAIGGEGVRNLGFVQPRQMPEIFKSHGAFVLPSTFEPWGVVIAEAAASGLPVICSSACGAGDDLVRAYYNGVITGPGDVESLANALEWIHRHDALLPEMGARSRELANAYAAPQWAARWHNYLLNAAERRA